jgi:hypothetical protein
MWFRLGLLNDFGEVLSKRRDRRSDQQRREKILQDIGR